MRQLKKLESWGAFQRSWKAVTTEPEAIGLLYAIARLETAKGLEDTDLFKRKAAFLLDQTDSDNPEIARLAQQLFVKELLESDMRLSWTGKIGATHLFIMAWLGQQRYQSLTRPPYPRFIRDFLWQNVDKWRAVHSGYTKEPYGKLEPGCYGNTDVLVSALVTWGMAQILIDSRNSHEITLPEAARLIVPCLEKHVTKFSKNPAQDAQGGIHVALHRAKLPVDLTDQDTCLDARRNNAMTLMLLQQMIVQESA